MRRRPFFFFFFRHHLNLGAKFWTKIELLSLTKLRKNISLPRNLLNQQKIDSYACADIKFFLKKYCTGLVEGVDLIFRLMCLISCQNNVSNKL